MGYFVILNNILTNLYKFNFFLKKSNYGINVYSTKLIISRAELNFCNKNITYNSTQNLILNDFLGNYLFNSNSFKLRNTLNIHLLNILGTYRGWRHSRGLPVRGQRTWSNSWSSYRSNLVLRSHKIGIARKAYTSIFSNDYLTAYLAEEANNMWRSQWYSEWLDAKRKRLSVVKTIKNTLKIDLQAMSKLQVGYFGKNIDPSKLKKQRKNVLTLGFDPGFTKLLFKNTNDSLKNKIYFCI